MRSIFLAMFLGMFLVSCARREEHNAVFTLATGVSLIEARNCNSNQTGGMPSVKKVEGDYLVTIFGHFPCETELEKPYLTMANEKKATLVISPKQSKLGFGSSCECGRLLIVRLSNRLEPGDTLYVLNDREVLGHLVMP